MTAHSRFGVHAADFDQTRAAFPVLAFKLDRNLVFQGQL